MSTIWPTERKENIFRFLYRDRKRKNFVGEDGNVKKIRTESGIRIPASYRKNMYPSNANGSTLIPRKSSLEFLQFPYLHFIVVLIILSHFALFEPFIDVLCRTKLL